MHPFAQITCIPLVSKDVLCSTWAPLLTPMVLRSFVYALSFRSESKDRRNGGVEITVAAQNGIRINLVFRGPNPAMRSGKLFWKFVFVNVRRLF